MDASSTVEIGHHRNIIPTARMMAYFRSFSDIPYAKEISAAVGGEEATRQILQEDFALLTPFGAALAEARYKCLDRLISGSTNVLELAVGLSFGRGLVISESPERAYVGTDLPESIVESKSLLEECDPKRRANYHLKAANVLSKDQMNEAGSILGARQDVAIINEGLWTYLTIEEQAAGMANIRRLLERYGGKWITPDISDSESEEQFNSLLGPELKAAAPRVAQRLERLTGRALAKNFLPTSEKAIGFIEESGFEVSQYPLIDDFDQLTSSFDGPWKRHEEGSYEPGLRQLRVSVMTLR
jgi:hypothetical protein